MSCGVRPGRSGFPPAAGCEKGELELNRFPAVLTLLRRERGLTQKQAAAELGVSQALLSHYERGIRECGLDFLVRAADYYGVTCDFLLGRTPGGRDSAPGSMTVVDVYEACCAINGLLPSGCEWRAESLGVLSLYSAVTAMAENGKCPKSWIGLKKRARRLTPYMAGMAEAGLVAGIPEKFTGEEPECLKRVIRSAEEMIGRAARTMGDEPLQREKTPGSHSGI